MKLTPEILTMVVTAIITALFGQLAKKFNWSTKDYIPFQNLSIGLFSGILACLFHFNDNIAESIILGIFAAMTAGGMYDLGKMKTAEIKEEKKEEKKDE